MKGKTRNEQPLASARNLAIKGYPVKVVVGKPNARVRQYHDEISTAVLRNWLTISKE